LGIYNLVVNSLMFIYNDLRLVSNETAEFDDVFDCEELVMLLDGVVEMNTALDVNSSDVRYGTLSGTAVLNKSVATLRLARSLASSGYLPTPTAVTVPACRGRDLSRTPEGRE
jgi:hypothetical protein